jgi:AraC-like DNA-binding protein
LGAFVASDDHGSGRAAREASERLVAWLLDLVASEGGDATALLRRVGVQESPAAFVANGLHHAPPQLLSRISATAAVVIGDLDAARVGRAPFRGGDWRLLFYCLISGRSLREAIERASEFMAAVNGRIGQISLHVSGEAAQIRWGPPSDPSSAVSLAGAVFGMINLHGLLSWLISMRIPVLKAAVPHDQALFDKLDLSLFQLPLQRGDCIALAFPASYLDYPVVSTLEDLSVHPTMSFMVEVVREPTPGGLVERSRQLMFNALKAGEGAPALPELAERLGLKAEMFRRRLRGAGASYNQIKHSCRRELGLDLLLRTSLSVEAISDQLGFCDSDAFRRAVHEWVGVSPSAYRKRASFNAG